VKGVAMRTIDFILRFLERRPWQALAIAIVALLVLYLTGIGYYLLYTVYWMFYAFWYVFSSIYSFYWNYVLPWPDCGFPTGRKGSSDPCAAAGFVYFFLAGILTIVTIVAIIVILYLSFRQR
jgi:hypothetical protein